MYRKQTLLTPLITNPIQTMDLSPDGRWVAVGQAINQTRSILTLWDAKTLALIRRIDLNTWLMRVRFLNETQFVITTAGENAAISLYDMTGRLLAERSTETAAFGWLHTVNNRMVAAGESLWVLDQNLTPLWTYTSPEPDSHPQGVLSSNGEYLAASEIAPNKIQFFELDSAQQVDELDGAFAQSHWLEVDQAGRYLLSIERYAKGVFVWDLTTKQRHLPHIINEDMRSFWCAHFHPTGEYCVLGNLIGFVSVLRLSDGDFVVDQKAHQARVWDVKFSPDGQRLFTASEDGVIHVWQAEG